jgi:hypothetical protein
MNAIDFSSIGNSISNDSNAFTKIHRLSKISNSNVKTSLYNDNLVLSKINNLYLSGNTLNNSSYQYGSNRQHNYSSLNSFLPSFNALVDNNSFKKFFNYSLNTNTKQSDIALSNKTLDNKTYEFNTQTNNMNHVVLNFTKNLDSKYSDYFFTKFLLNFNFFKNMNSTLDGKNNNNPLLDYYGFRKKKILNFKKPLHFSAHDDLTSKINHNFFT